MDYRIFAKENHNLTALNSAEISDPHSGLKEFLIGKSASQCKQDVQDLLVAVFEKHHWRQFGAPVNLYQKAKEVARLIDFVWLIVTCELGQQYNKADMETYYLEEQNRRRTFRKLFDETLPIKNKQRTVPEIAIARAIFGERHNLMLKDDVQNIWLPVALNSSYMSNLSVDYYNVEMSTDPKDYWNIQTIIDVGFGLVDRCDVELDVEKLQYYRLFATDVDHPDYLYGDRLEVSYSRLADLFRHIDELRLPKAIRKWYALIDRVDHWKSHSDPGNLLFLKQTLQQLIEVAWLWTREGITGLGNEGGESEYTAELTREQIIDPVGVVRSFFEKRPLHEWKNLLETWLVQSLSDKRYPETEITSMDGDDMIRLVQAARLIEWRW